MRAALERISRLETTVHLQQQRISQLECIVSRGPQQRPAAVSPAAAARASTAVPTSSRTAARTGMGVRSTSPVAAARVSASTPAARTPPTSASRLDAVSRCGRAGGRDELADSLGMLTTSYEQKLRDREDVEVRPTATTAKAGAAAQPRRTRSSAPDIFNVSGDASGSLRPRPRSEEQQLRPRSEEVRARPRLPSRPASPRPAPPRLAAPRRTHLTPHLRAPISSAKPPISSSSGHPSQGTHLRAPIPLLISRAPSLAHCRSGRCGGRPSRPPHGTARRRRPRRSTAATAARTARAAAPCRRSGK